jgi:hypothetical protein
MSKKSKWLMLGAALFGGSTLFHSGCLSFGGLGGLGGVDGFFGDFWSGFWNTGFPTNNQWLNIGLDVLNEELFG